MTLEPGHQGHPATGQPSPESLQLDVGDMALHVAHWPAPAEGSGTARRPVVIVHGYAEHIGRYGGLASALTAAGHHVWGADLRGHGRSPGRRADVRALDVMLADIDQVVGMVESHHARSDGAPRGPAPVLLGHSMGGAFAMAYVVQNPRRAAALVLSAPAVHLALRPQWQSRLVAGLARWAPTAGVGRVGPRRLSYDRAAVRAFAEDPLVWHGLVPARTALAIYDAGRFSFAGAAQVALPVLMFQGDRDTVVPPRSTRRLFQQLGSVDKELVVLSPARHEPLHDAARDELFGHLTGWLERH